MPALAIWFPANVYIHSPTLLPCAVYPRPLDRVIVSSPSRTPEKCMSVDPLPLPPRRSFIASGPTTARDLSSTSSLRAQKSAFPPPLFKAIFPSISFIIRPPSGQVPHRCVGDQCTRGNGCPHTLSAGIGSRSVSSLLASLLGHTVWCWGISSLSLPTMSWIVRVFSIPSNSPVPSPISQCWLGGKMRPWP
jgi:hypothetical protein